MFTYFKHLQHNAAKKREQRDTRDPADWMARNPLAPASPRAQMSVRFMTPLIGRDKSNDWQTVCRWVQLTGESLLRQTDPNWDWVICGQDRPESLPDDPRVTFVPFPFPTGGAISDKNRKKRMAIRHMAHQPPRDGYLFMLDADDICHPALVEYILGDNNGHGYYLPHGWMADVAARKLMPLGQPAQGYSSAQPFFKPCGSSAAVRFDTRRGPSGAGPAHERGRHAQLVENVARYGLTLQPVPFDAMIYCFNHGDNTQALRGATESRVARIAENAVDADMQADILTRFGLTDTPEF